MIVRLAWSSLMLAMAAAVMVSLLLGVIWLWGIYAAPSMTEARSLKSALEAGPRPATELFPEDWQALCIAGPGDRPLDVIASQTQLAQTPCKGWDTAFLEAGNLASLLLVSGRGCRAVPVRIDLIDMKPLAGICVARGRQPVLGLAQRGLPARDFLTIE